MKKKIVSLILASMMAVTGLAGCGSSNSAATGGQDTAKGSSGGDVHITYGIWDSNQEKGLRKMADEFEGKNPGIKIDIQVTGWSDYWTMLEAAATGGSLPDTFWMHSNEIYRYASNGMLMDLTDKINKSDDVKLSNYPEGLVKIYNLNNKQYAIPKDYDTIGLWYNKTMFDKAGISYPDETWNWDKLYEAAKKLTTGDGKQYGFLAPLHNQEGYYNFVYQNGGTIITDDKVSGYDNPKTIEAMKYYVRFVSEGLSPKIFDDAARAETLQNGLCAMGFFGSWNLSGFAANDYMTKNFNVTVLPSANDGKRASIFNGLGNAISANTKRPEEAWKWVQYLSSKDGQTKQAELGVAISAYNGTADAWINSNKTFNIKCFVDMVKYAQIRPYSNTTAKWEDKAYEMLKGAFTGEKTVEDACKDTAKMMNDALKEEK
ncbi:ABC transporter substrate-binding protein [Clostridium beijerinckii]|jgi:carbohydrate ABC transporter substrate-binding protein, CUT1 family (TC 3.A.1.1.-)|uniref:Sugar ABC transporter substrate-binding protein n=2 Tax=Clostridium beijerinckii TaxID=1520 RepID=A0AAE2RNW0_CLOBE|nr:sugar ABC transporter substrate-binding protein [Clostridium beijerinckii]ABR36554.1 extracellular solute-binding protein, family 1 [Clostridium beijerinckii NCIMB 8052]AIU02219.1 extracellular solute-binding protein [Clostridium beijerinckii ATCC 35702]MBF7808798.1 sugar ABC transporter substrate-binding protein [Clostridium beijerinckii]NRT22377.1 multiple sugar transport system substrate-binding protein [Clostridium beijerinckii]NRT65110.1 multiple sugar transport system substrate-bindin